jgi:hypothetical protein
MAAISVASDTGTNGISTSLSSASIDRSHEFLSCARTAVKVAKSQYIKKKKQELQHDLRDDSDIDENDLLNSDDLKDARFWFLLIDPNSLSLYSVYNHAPPANDLNNIGHGANNMKSILRQGCTLLEDMETKLSELDGLVRRRGQSNDPTNEITFLVSQLERIASTLGVLIQTQMVPIRIYGQKAEHYKQIQLWFQLRTQQYSQRLKDILAIRATVVAEQTKRRRRFVAQSVPTANPSTTTISSSALTNNRSAGTKTIANSGTTMATVQSYYQSDNPLFAAGPILAPTMQQSQLPTLSSEERASSNSAITNANVYQSFDSVSSPVRTTPNDDARRTASISSLQYNQSQNDSFSKLPAGYGGASTRPRNNYYNNSKGTEHHYRQSEKESITSTMGMRRRGGGSGNGSSSDGNGNNHYEQESQQQQQLLIERQTQSRLREARMAEKSLAELGTVFGKMSTLIMQQSETITKIEDDVEAAHGDVSDGQNEITILYQLKKGNRMLIIKTYSLLIFLIILMRLYASPKR